LPAIQPTLSHARNFRLDIGCRVLITGISA
jgi:hypothetical protein